MKDDKDNLTWHNILGDIEYTDDGDRPSRSGKEYTEELPRRVAKIESRIEDESNYLQGEGMKIIIRSNIVVNWTRLGLLGLKLSGYSHTLTEASKILDELYKRGEIQNEQQYPNALDKCHTK